MNTLDTIRSFVEKEGQTPEERIALYINMLDKARNRIALDIKFGEFVREVIKKEQEAQKVAATK